MENPWADRLVGDAEVSSTTFTGRHDRDESDEGGAVDTERRRLVISTATLLGLTAINCLGVRAGSNVQSALMLMKSAAIAGMVVLGLLWGGGRIHPLPLLDQPLSFGLLAAIGAAMTPVAFAYGGWQTASFVAGEMRDSRRDLSRGLLLGVAA